MAAMVPIARRGSKTFLQIYHPLTTVAYRAAIHVRGSTSRARKLSTLFIDQFDTGN